MTAHSAEPDGVNTPAKPRTRRAPGSAAKRRSPAAKTARVEVAEQVVAARMPHQALAARLCAAAILTVAFVYLLVGGDGDVRGRIKNGAPASVSADELARFAQGRESAVYWAGRADARRVELTTTPSAVFVRYLPAGVQAGGGGSSLTVATYPLADAYATALGRSRGKGMTSRRTEDGGIAVWGLAQPTSVYLAWRDTPSLVEVYAPTGSEARTVALSGRVRRVRG